MTSGMYPSSSPSPRTTPRTLRWVLLAILATSLLLLAPIRSQAYDPTIQLTINPAGVISTTATFTVSGSGVTSATEIRVYDDLDQLVGYDDDPAGGWKVTANATDLPRGHVTFTPVAVISGVEVEGEPLTREVRPTCLISGDTTWHAQHSPIYAGSCSLAVGATLTIESGALVSPVTGTFTVADASTLLIEEGATLAFSGSTSKVNVTAGGTMVAEGSSSDPVSLSAYSSGGWGGIHLGGSSSKPVVVTLDETEITGIASTIANGAFTASQYYSLTLNGVSTDAPFRVVTSTSTDDGTYISVENSSFNSATSTSVQIGTSGAFPTALHFAGNTASQTMYFYYLRDADYVANNHSTSGDMVFTQVVISEEYTSNTTSSSRSVMFSGNSSVAPTSTVTLSPGQSWRINGTLNIPSGATLALDPGTQVTGTSSSTQIKVSSGGNLTALGTSTDPIMLTATSSWAGVHVAGTSALPAQAELEWTEISNVSATAGAFTLSSYYTLRLDHLTTDAKFNAVTSASTYAGTHLEITNSSFGSVQIGYSSYGPTSLVFEENEATDTMGFTSPPAASSIQENTSYGHLTFTNTLLNQSHTSNVAVTPSTLRPSNSSVAPGTTLTLGPDDDYWSILNTLTIPDGARLELLPGTTLRSSGKISVTAGGELRALGTSGSPISVLPYSSSWSGITAAGSSTKPAVVDLEWVEVAGTAVPFTLTSYYDLSLSHSIIAGNFVAATTSQTTPGANLSISDSTFTSSSPSALTVGAVSSGCQAPSSFTLTGNTFAGGVQLACLTTSEVSQNDLAKDLRLIRVTLQPGYGTNSVASGYFVEVRGASVAAGAEVMLTSAADWKVVYGGTLQTALSVPATSTLTLEPGVSLLFGTNTTFPVSGTFNANGTESEPVLVQGPLALGIGAIADLDWTTLEKVTLGYDYTFTADHSTFLTGITATDYKGIHKTMAGHNLEIRNSTLPSIGIGTFTSTWQYYTCPTSMSGLVLTNNYIPGNVSLTCVWNPYTFSKNNIGGNLSIQHSALVDDLETNTLSTTKAPTLNYTKVAPGHTALLVGSIAKWLIPDDLQVPATSKLVIEPGARLDFGKPPSTGPATTILVAGELEAIGTRELPIQMFGRDGLSRDWTGIKVSGTGVADLKWVDFSDAGHSWGAGGDQAAIVASGSASVSIDSVRFERTGIYDILKATGTATIEVSRSDFMSGPVRVNVASTTAHITAPHNFWYSNPSCQGTCANAELTPTSPNPHRIPGHAQYWSPELDQAWDGYVNVGLGAYVRTFTDLTPISYGTSLPLARTYNSANDAPGGAFGAGWFATFEAQAKLADDDGTVAVHLPDGAVELFTPDSGGNYLPPSGSHATLVEITGGYLYTSEEGAKLHFTGPSGGLAKIDSLAGHETEIHYGTSGTALDKPVEIAPPSGRSIELTWNTTGRLSSASLGASTWTYTYSGANLSSACDPRGKCTTYAYDAIPALAVITHPEGNTEKIFYALGEDDSIERPRFHLIQIRDGENNPTDYDYSTPGQVVVTDPLEREATSYYNTDLQITQVKDAAGYSTWYGYAADGNQDEITDRTGRLTSYEYDTNGFLTEETSPGGFTTYYERGPYGHLLSLRDPRSANSSDNTFKTTYTYDADWNLTIIDYPDEGLADSGQVIQTWTDGTESAEGDGLTPAGLIKTRTDPRGFTTEFFYDSEGDLRRIDHPDGASETFTHTTSGQVLTHNGQGHALLHAYDNAGLLTSTTHPVVTNPVSSGESQLRVRYEYDGNRRLLAEVQEDLKGTEERVTSYTYTATDHLATLTHPDQSITVFEYDEAGNQVKITDPDDRVTHHAHNHLNLLTDIWTEFIHEDNLVEHRTYDHEGRVTSVVDGRGISTNYIYATVSGRLERVARSGVTLEEHVYDAAGNTTRTQYGSGQATVDLAYNNNGLLTSEKLWLTKGATSGEYRETTHTYFKAGLPKEVRVFDSLSGEWTETRWTYEEMGRPKTKSTVLTTSPATLATTTFEYDLAGNLVSILDPEGNETVHAYDNTGRLEKTIHPSASHWAGSSLITTTAEERFGYNAFGNLTHHQDPLGHITEDTYNQMSRLVGRTHPEYDDHTATPVAPTESFTYDHDGNLLSHTGRDGEVTSFEYDELGRLRIRLDPALPLQDPGSTEYSYDGWTELISKVTDPENRYTEFEYDDFGRLSKSSEGGGPDTVRTYDTLGNLTGLDAPEVPAESWTYNTDGQALTHVDPAGRTWTYTYGPHRSPLTITTPLSHTTTHVYDAAGRIMLTTDSEGQKTSSVYDKNGLLRSQTSPRGNTGSTPDPNYTTEYVYDAQGRLRQVLAPGNRTTFYDYDKAGQLARVRNNRPATPTTLYEYNAGGLLTTLTDPEAREWDYLYDAAGRLRIEEQPGNVEITYSYDNLGNQVSKSASGTGVAAAATSHSYDRTGLLVEATHPDGTISIGYNALGLPDEVSAPYGTTTYGYDDLGRLVNVTDPLGTFIYSYNSRSLLAAINDPIASVDSVFDYDDAGRLSEITHGDRLHEYTYDDADRLELETVSDTGLAATLATFEYDYDLDGNPTTVEIEYPGVANPAEGVYTYTYDPGGYLTQATLPSSQVLEYIHDQAGNRTKAGSTSYSYDLSDRITGSTDAVHGNASYTYTPFGALTEITGGAAPSEFSYDALGRTLSQTVGADTATFAYDSLGRIASRDDGTSVLDFSYRGLGPDPVSDGTWSYALSPNGKPLALTNGTTTYSAGFNRHGDITTLYTSGASTPTVAASTVYDPYGQVLGQTGVTTPLGFQADWTDPLSGRVSMHARWYDPRTAGFTSRDLHPGELTRPHTLNRYAYALPNPLAYHDPSGYCGLLVTSWLGAASAGNLGDCFTKEAFTSGLRTEIASVRGAALGVYDSASGLVMGAAEMARLGAAATLHAARGDWASAGQLASDAGVAIVKGLVDTPGRWIGSYTDLDLATSDPEAYTRGASATATEAGLSVAGSRLVGKGLATLQRSRLPGMGPLKTLAGQPKGSLHELLSAAFKTSDRGSVSLGRPRVVAELDVGTYGNLTRRGVVGDGLTPDHIPSFAAVRTAIEQRVGRRLTTLELRDLRNDTHCLVICESTHRSASRTYGGRNTASQIAQDARDLGIAAYADTSTLRTHLLRQGLDAGKVDSAIAELHRLNRAAGWYP